MTSWKLEVEGLTEEERRAARLGAMLSDFRPWWPMLVPLFIGWMREQFETEGAFGGEPWAPLSPDYAAWKAEHYPGKGILIAEGDLRKAASNPTRIMLPMELILEIRDPKAGYHQEGTASMPKRPLIWATQPLPVTAELSHVADVIAHDMLRRAGYT